MTQHDEKYLNKASRLITKTLRHAPQDLGITLDPNGWTDTSLLLEALPKHGFTITQAQLEIIVATNDKKRLTLSDDGTRIRAAQGHSVPVALDVEAKVPPIPLYHGTAQKNVASILREGLTPRNRQQVHLSADRETATSVGRRHGTPVILVINTASMQADGIVFYQADNGVWLTDHVAPHYIHVKN